MSKLFTGKFVTSILVLLMATSTLHTYGQTQGSGLSNEDEAEIIEAMLQLGTKPSESDFGSNPFGSDFGMTRNFSSENLSSLSASRIKQHGFSLISPYAIEAGKRDHVIDYVVLRGIDPKDGMVVVRVSVVSEGKPCFAAAFSRQSSLSYVFKKSGTQWVGQVLKRPVPFPFMRSLATPRN